MRKLYESKILLSTLSAGRSWSSWTRVYRSDNKTPSSSGFVVCGGRWDGGWDGGWDQECQQPDKECCCRSTDRGSWRWRWTILLDHDLLCWCEWGRDQNIHRAECSVCRKREKLYGDACQGYRGAELDNDSAGTGKEWNKRKQTLHLWMDSAWLGMYHRFHLYRGDSFKNRRY